MNKEQVINLLKRIKGGYGITITEEILEEYSKILSKYDYNDVIVNLEGKIQIRISNKVILWLYSIINYLLFNTN